MPIQNVSDDLVLENVAAGTGFVPNVSHTVSGTRSEMDKNQREQEYTHTERPTNGLDEISSHYRISVVIENKEN